MPILATWHYYRAIWHIDQDPHSLANTYPAKPGDVQGFRGAKAGTGNETG
jgi:hypothetical protein